MAYEGVHTKPKLNRRTILPLQDLGDIRRVRAILAHEPRNLLFFDMAVGTGLKMKDLLQLKFKDVQTLAPGDRIPVADRNDGGPIINETIYRTLQTYFRKVKPHSNDYLFKSRKRDLPLNLSSVSDMVKSWFDEAGLIGLTGVKSLRKTWEVHFKSGYTIDKDLEGAQGQVLKPLDSSTLWEKVYQELLQAIVSGGIRPGERLVTGRIAQQMNVSPMPVREALTRLEVAGFLSSKGRRGWVVVELSKDDLLEVLEIRMTLETMAVKKAVPNSDKKTLNRLEAIHQRYVQAVHQTNPEELFRSHMDFHMSLYNAAHMPLLQSIIIGLWNRYSPYLHLIMKEVWKFEPDEIMKFHQGMLEGMKLGDSDFVSQCLIGDLKSGRERVIRLMNGLGKA